MNSIKILDNSYKQQIIQLERIKNKIGGLKKDDAYAKSFEESLDKYFGNSPNYLIYGSLENDKVVSLLFQSFIMSKRIWVIPYMFTLQFSDKFKFQEHSLGDLVSKAMEVAEARGFKTYYYALAEKYGEVYLKKWLQTNYKDLGFYDAAIEATIPANTVPEDNLYCHLLGNKSVNVPMNIHVRTYKQEITRGYGNITDIEKYCSFKNFNEVYTIDK